MLEKDLIDIQSKPVRHLAALALAHHLYQKDGVLFSELVKAIEGKRCRLLVAYYEQQPIALLFNTKRAIMFYTKRSFRRQGLAKMLWEAFLAKYPRNPNQLLGWSASNKAFFPALGIEDKKGVAFYQELGWTIQTSSN